MADIIDRRPGGGGSGNVNTKYVDDAGDSSYPEAVSSHVNGWDLSNLRWSKVAVNGTTGALLVEATLATGDVEIGAVEIKNSTTDDRATVSAAGALKVDASSVAVPVTDNSGTLTVDAPVGTPVWVRLSDGSAAFVGSKVSASSIPVVIASDQGAVATAPAQATAANLNAQVGGLGASGATSVGNPVRVAGKYNSSKPVFTDGQTADIQTDSRGGLFAVIRNNDGATPASVLANADTLAAGTVGLAVVGLTEVYNGSSWDRMRGDITNGVDVDVTRLPALVAGSATIGAVNQTTGQGKTLLFGAITQGAAGTTQLVAADAAKKVKVVSYTVILDAAGSFKFDDGTANLTGVMPMAANGGAVAAGQPSSHLFETGAINRPLNITTVTGKAFGHFSYYLEA